MTPAVFFTDPPYTASTKRAGRRLYRHNTVDHNALFELMAEQSGQFFNDLRWSDERIVSMARQMGFI